MGPGMIVGLSRMCEDILQRDGLLDRSGRPLLYSPAFCDFTMDLRAVAERLSHLRWLNTKEEV